MQDQAGHDTLHEELAAGYAVGALDRPDLERFRELLTGCDRCRSLAAEYSAVAAFLPAALEPLDASPGLRERIMEEVRRPALLVELEPSQAPRLREGSVEAPPPRSLGAARAARTRRLFDWALPLAALVTVVLGLGYWNYRLQQRVAEQAALIQVQHEALAAVAAGGRQWALAGTPEAAGAHGLLVQDPHNPRPVLVVQGLPPLSSDRAYQAWVISGSTPTGAGLLEPDGRGGQVARLDLPLGSADTVAVTIEPARGSVSPTGPIVVAGKL